jgi:hypothetical protein
MQTAGKHRGAAEMSARVLPTGEKDEILLRLEVKALAGILLCTSAKKVAGHFIGCFQQYPPLVGTPG